MAEFLSEAWLELYLAALNADKEWRNASKYFSSRIGFRSGSRSAVLDVNDGAVIVAVGDRQI